jgi:hypothetical protein
MEERKWKMKTGKFNIKKKENKNGKIKMKNFQ